MALQLLSKQITILLCLEPLGVSCVEKLWTNVTVHASYQASAGSVRSMKDPCLLGQIQETQYICSLFQTGETYEVNPRKLVTWFNLRICLTRFGGRLLRFRICKRVWALHMKLLYSKNLLPDTSDFFWLWTFSNSGTIPCMVSSSFVSQCLGVGEGVLKTIMVYKNDWNSLCRARLLKILLKLGTFFWNSLSRAVIACSVDTALSTSSLVGTLGQYLYQVQMVGKKDFITLSFRLME